MRTFLVLLFWTFWVSMALMISSMALAIEGFFGMFVSASIFFLFFMMFFTEYPELTRGWYWRSKINKIWPRKPRVYPPETNDKVAEEYRNRLFRN